MPSLERVSIFPSTPAEVVSFLARDELERRGYSEFSKNTFPWGVYVNGGSCSMAIPEKNRWARDTTGKVVGEWDLNQRLFLVAPREVSDMWSHHKRHIYWEVMTGAVRLITRQDEELRIAEFYSGEELWIPARTQYRVQAIKNRWTAIREMWVHTNPNDHSDSNDIYSA